MADVHDKATRSYNMSRHHPRLTDSIPGTMQKEDTRIVRKTKFKKQNHCDCGRTLKYLARFEIILFLTLYNCLKIILTKTQ